MITQIPNWQTLTPEEIRAYLLGSEWHPTNRVITLGVLREALPPEGYFLVRQSLEAATVPQGDSIEARAIAADMSDAFAAMRTVGISLSTTDRQAAIDLLAAKGKWPDSLRELVKSMGGYWLPRWQTEGIASEPSLQDVIAAISEEHSAMQREELRGRMDAIFNQIGTAEQPQAVAALRTIADELDAV
jgi:hypothetical protein